MLLYEYWEADEAPNTPQSGRAISSSCPVGYFLAKNAGSVAVRPRLPHEYQCASVHLLVYKRGAARFAYDQ